MWLYKLTNKTNGKAYIGTSVNPIEQRLSRHLYAAKSGRRDMAIACAIRKYGIDNFDVECIGHAKNYDQLLQMEVKAIKTHGTLFPNGYNITEGGMGACRPCSETTKAKISARTLGRTPWNKGKKTGSLSEEHRRKLSERSFTKRNGPWNKGVPITEEHRQKLIAAKRRNPTWNKGKKTGPMSEAEKLKRSEGVKRARAEKFWSSRPKGNEKHETIQ